MQLLVTTSQPDPRLSQLESRYQVRCLLTPELTLGERLNHAALSSQADWFVFACQPSCPTPAAWPKIISRLNAHKLDVLMIGMSRPGLFERLLQRFFNKTLLLPHYFAVTRSWLEKIGGFDPELDHNALHDLLQRLQTCPTRIQYIKVPLKAPLHFDPPTVGPTPSLRRPP
ncbi:hypothetical protein LG290_01140 [Halomonas sediminis]